MPNITGIEWTATPRPDGTMEPGYTSNPVKYRDQATGKTVWACEKVSAGCRECYAEALAKRLGRGGPFNAATTAGVEPYLCNVEANNLLRSKKIAGKRIFIGDMTDVFGSWVSDAILDKLFAVFAIRRDVTFQLLTKRPERMAAYLTDDHLPCRLHEAVKARMGYDHPNRPAINPTDLPFKNCWLGTSVENQAAADERIPHLLRCPAAVRFLSAEPLLGPMERLHTHLIHRRQPCSACGVYTNPAYDHLPAPCWKCGKKDAWDRPIHWCVAGGESGHDARPMNLEWMRGIVRQCQAAKVPVFVKQLGACPVVTHWTDDKPSAPYDSPWTHRDPTADRCAGPVRPIRLAGYADKKGGDIDTFPADLRVREFPATPETHP